MPTFIHGKNTGVILAQYDVSAFLNGASYAMTSDTAETTAFGANARSYIPSFPGGTATLSGMFDGTATGIDAILQSIQSGANPVPLTIAAQGIANGNRAFVANIYETNYNITSPVNDVVAISADFTYASRMGAGYVLRNYTSTMAGSGNGTSVDYSTTTSSGGVANLHVITNTRDAGSITVNVQDSADNVTFATVTGGTFTAVNGGVLSSQNLIIPGAVRQYVRINWTVTGGTIGAYGVVAAFAKT